MCAISKDTAYDFLFHRRRYFGDAFPSRNFIGQKVAVNSTEFLMRDFKMRENKNNFRHLPLTGMSLKIVLYFL